MKKERIEWRKEFGIQRHNHNFYTVYRNIRSRCYNSKSHNYGRYGARGVTVCERWLNGFKNFKEDMFPSYKKGLSIERIDNTKGYSPENCRWATSKEQTRNRRSNISLTYNGKTQCVMDWVNELGLHYYTVYQRLKREMPIERILSVSSLNTGINIQNNSK